MSKQFNGDTIIEYLYPNGFDLKEYRINDLLKEYFPSPTRNDLVRIRTIISELTEKKYIYALPQFGDLGIANKNILHDLDNVEIIVSLQQGGLEYFQNKNKPIAQNIQIIGSTGTVVNSPNATQTITIDNSQVHKLIQEIRDNVNTDNSIQEVNKNGVLQVLNEVEQEVGNGKISTTTVSKILEYSGKISSIGSFLLTLAKFLLGG